MSKRRGGSPPRSNPRQRSSALANRIAIPGLLIVAPDPPAVSLGGSETAGLQLAAELVRQGHRVPVAWNTPEPFTWHGVSTWRAKSRRGRERDGASPPHARILSARSLTGEVRAAPLSDRITLDALALADKALAVAERRMREQVWSE